MVELARTVRFCVTAASQTDPGGLNGFAAIPPMTGLGAFYELHLMCRGNPDPQTGYLMNISDLDAVARRELIPIIARTYQTAPHTDPLGLMPELLRRFQQAMGEVCGSIQWRLTPYYCLTIEAADMAHVQLSQQFEFAAAHRLHVDELSPQHNRRLFGRCNNEHGHGHNYRLEVAVSVAVTASDGQQAMSLPTLEQIVHDTIIQRFDHTNLNLDRPEFASMNPSVENIAGVCYALLAEPVRSAGAELHHVTVWETPKTSCTVARRS